MTALDRAAAALGGLAALASAIGVSQSAPHMWKKRGRVPEENGPAIEFATKGLITVEALCDAVSWQRIPAADWPHPDGRPCIDVAAPAPAGQEA